MATFVAKHHILVSCGKSVNKVDYSIHMVQHQIVEIRLLHFSLYEQWHISHNSIFYYVIISSHVHIIFAMGPGINQNTVHQLAFNKIPYTVLHKISIVGNMHVSNSIVQDIPDELYSLDAFAYCLLEPVI